MLADARERLQSIEDVFTALAHPARRQILMTIHFWGGEMSAGAIAGRFAHAWPTTTRHLQVLAKAGLLSERREGRARIYTIKRARLDVVREWLCWFEKKDGQ